MISDGELPLSHTHRTMILFEVQTIIGAVHKLYNGRGVGGQVPVLLYALYWGRGVVQDLLYNTKKILFIVKQTEEPSLVTQQIVELQRFGNPAFTDAIQVHDQA